MGGALNARPGKIDSALPPLGLPLGSPLSETVSEREHREHAFPRLLDRPPPLQHAGSFHGGRGERINPDEPIAVTPTSSIERSSLSGSDHTIDALRTPPPMHPSERVVRAEISPIDVFILTLHHSAQIPPLPRHYSGGYVPGSRSPTDIYSSHPYEVVHDVRHCLLPKNLKPDDSLKGTFTP